MSANNKKTEQQAPSAKPGRTPESVTSRERSEIDEDAVSKAVTAENGDAERGTKSVLPGPPIPPEVQAEVRQERQSREARGSGRRGPPVRKQQGEKSMIDPNDIKEHMEVVGSDGEHVGTVDHCEGPNIIKLTKSDPAAGGEHHYIPLAWVEKIDQRVHLAHPGMEARARWG
jgi:hypothetical protein